MFWHKYVEANGTVLVIRLLHHPAKYVTVAIIIACGELSQWGISEWKCLQCLPVYVEDICSDDFRFGI